MTTYAIAYFVLFANLTPVFMNSRYGQHMAITPIVESRQKQVESLLASAKSTVGVELFYGATAVSIRKLGALRAIEAVPFLVDNMTFRGLGPTGSTDSIPTPEEIHPSVYALAQIGLPAFPPLLKKVESTDAEITHLYAAAVFYEAMGYDDARAYLGTKVDRQENRDKKQRLRSLLKQLDELHAKR